MLGLEGLRRPAPGSKSPVPPSLGTCLLRVTPSPTQRTFLQFLPRVHRAGQRGRTPGTQLKDSPAEPTGRPHRPGLRCTQPCPSLTQGLWGWGQGMTGRAQPQMEMPVGAQSGRAVQVLGKWLRPLWSLHLGGRLGFGFEFRFWRLTLLNEEYRFHVNAIALWFSLVVISKCK